MNRSRIRRAALLSIVVLLAALGVACAPARPPRTQNRPPRTPDHPTEPAPETPHRQMPRRAPAEGAERQRPAAAAERSRDERAIEMPPPEGGDATGRTLSAEDDRGLAACNGGLRPGDVCTVAAGSYTVPIDPSRSGTERGRIAYLCPSRKCLIRTQDGRPAFDAVGRSFITAKGFTFDGGPVLMCGRGPQGPASAGIFLDEIATKDSNGPGLDRNATLVVGACRDSMLRNFDLYLTPSDSGTGNDVATLGYNIAAGQPHARRIVLKDGVIRGGWNGLTVASCDACVIDGVRLWGAKNHQLTIGSTEGSPLGPVGTVIRNSVVMTSAVFGEPSVSTRWAEGLTLLNNAFVVGLRLPSDGHTRELTGVVTIRNNILYNPGQRALLTLDARGGAKWDVDYNAYVGAARFDAAVPTVTLLRRNGETSWFADPDGDGVLGCGTADCEGRGDMDSWRQASANPDGSPRDGHSVFFVDRDWKKTDARYAAPLWGGSGPVWAAFVSGCSPTPGGFQTHSVWGRGLAAGEKVVHEGSGFFQTVRAVRAGDRSRTACGDAVTLDPAPQEPPRNRSWFLSWGEARDLPPEAGPAQFTYRPAAGSPVIDAGDPALCGHTPAGAGCDIGPAEFEEAAR